MKSSRSCATDSMRERAYKEVEVILRIVISAFLMMTLPAYVHAGIFTNGAQKSADQDNVWFLGDAPVEYCIESNGAARVDLKQFVRESIDAWLEFFRSYQLDQMAFQRVKGKPPLQLALNFREVARCDRPSSQLRILLGKIDPMVSVVLESQPDAKAFAARNDYDYRTYRTGGIIYVADLDLSKLKLKHLFMHELGHVFGMSHDSLPIMASNAVEMVQRNGPYDDFLGKIETDAWRYRYRGACHLDFGSVNASQSPDFPQFESAASTQQMPFDRHELKIDLEPVDKTSGLQRKVSLTIQNTVSGERKIFDGVFQIRSEATGIHGVQGPSLHTTWDCGSCAPGDVVEKRFLDARSSYREAEGYFIFEGDQKAPAIIEARPSLNIRLFLPTSDKWWSTRIYPATAYWINNQKVMTP